MKKIALMTVALAAISTPAMAQNSAALCKIYSAQGGAAAVPANYQAGVDVNGNPVVSADGSMVSPVGAPGSVRIPVTVELAQQLGAAVPAGTEMNAAIGVVNIAANGTVSFNGQDLTAQTAALCAQPYHPTEAKGDGVTKASTSATASTNNGFDYDAAWSPAKAAAAGVISGSDSTPAFAAPVPTPSAPMVSAPPQKVIPAVPNEPSLADEPTYAPPAVVPVANATVSEEARPAEIVGNADTGGAVHTPAQAEAVAEQDGIMYGEGR